MTDQQLRGRGEDLRDRAIRQLRQKREHLLRYLLTGGFLVLMWAFFGAGALSLVIVLIIWGIAVAIDAWNTYWRKPPSEDQIRREMARMR